jgi:hypothetical protein
MSSLHNKNGIFYDEYRKEIQLDPEVVGKIDTLTVENPVALVS